MKYNYKSRTSYDKSIFQDTFFNIYFNYSVMYTVFILYCNKIDKFLL
jgi:hypothetical protein